MRNRQSGLAIWLFIVMVVVSCAQKKEHPQSPTNPTRTSTDAAQGPELMRENEDKILVDTYSNIRKEDYVGPEMCGDCHPKNYASWKKHPHSRMNMMATDETILGDFSGVHLSYGTGRVVFHKHGGDFVVSYYNGERVIRKFRITRVIGWRYEQDYVGVQIQGPEPPGDLLYSEEIRIGFAYSLDRHQWLPQSYLEPTEYAGSEYLTDGTLRYNPFDPTRQSFNKRCAYCHNTYPYDLRVYKLHTEDGLLSGFPPGPGASPEIINTLATQTGDAHFQTEEALPTDRFVTVGISCESCHFGGREHAIKNKEIRFVPTHPLLAKWTPNDKNARKNPDTVNAICRQCHHSGAGAKDNWPDGSASVNSMEAIEQDRGGCKGAIRCTHCHNTHIKGPDSGAPVRQEHVDACVGCHQVFQEAKAVRAHSLHAPDQATCLDCHMPRIVQGIQGYNRTHRISSPTDKKILATGMPNACNLCHLDKSLAWTQDALEKGWGKWVPLPQSLARYFDNKLTKPAGEAWLVHPFYATRLIAANAYAQSPWGKKVLPDLLQFLDDPNAYTRTRFLLSVEKILGQKLTDAEYTLTGSPERRKTQIQQLRKRFTEK